MEKRLGIAQLCIMVAVLVFMALTRGSRGENMDHALLPRLSRSNRTTSLSGTGELMLRPRTGSNPVLPTRSLDGGIARKKGTGFAPSCCLYYSLFTRHSGGGRWESRILIQRDTNVRPSRVHAASRPEQYADGTKLAKEER